MKPTVKSQILDLLEGCTKAEVTLILNQVLKDVDKVFILSKPSS
jgi:hypothetical protein